MPYRIRVRMTLEEQQGTDFHPLKTFDIGVIVRCVNGVWKLSSEQLLPVRQGIRVLLRVLVARESARR